MNEWNIKSLDKYVKKCQNKHEKNLHKSSNEWLKVSAENKIDYELKWLGVPIIQTAEDIVLMQELIFKVKPDFIIETGIAHGGSLIFYASLFEILGKGKVIGVDIDIREHNRQVIESHPLFKRIELVLGNSVAEETINKIKQMVPNTAKTIVCLDSNHYKEHVFEELKTYQSFIDLHSYIVVFDTVTSSLAKSGVCHESYIDNGPMEAVDDFIEINSNFIIDKDFNKLYTSTSHDGYLKRIR